MIGEINTLVASESLSDLPGVKFEVVLGGDYKVSMHVECMSYYSCISCTFE